MIKLVVLYNHPDDPAAFDEHYAGTHLPLARKIPHVERIEAARIESVRGSDGTPPFHAIAELYYESEEAMGLAAASPEYQEALADQPNFNTGGSVAWLCRTFE